MLIANHIETAPMVAALASGQPTPHACGSPSPPKRRSRQAEVQSVDWAPLTGTPAGGRPSEPRCRFKSRGAMANLHNKRSSDWRWPESAALEGQSQFRTLRGAGSGGVAVCDTTRRLARATGRGNVPHPCPAFSTRSHGASWHRLRRRLPPGRQLRSERSERQRPGRCGTQWR